MRIAHLSAYAGSGMNAVAESTVTAERAIGLDSHLINLHNASAESLEPFIDSDIVVAHTHFPNELRYRMKAGYKLVYPCHGTPERVFYSSVQDGQKGYGHGDGLMLMQYWLQNADAIVTFWPRHQAILDSMTDKATKIHLVPMGVDKTFWSAGASKGKFAGAPSVFTAENCWEIKWPFDLFIAWPWVYREIPNACLHCCYLPTDQHRWWFPLINRNGASYGAHVSPVVFAHEELRNVLKSVDFQIGLVRYGDHNRLSLEANAAGATTISYKGNVYSDYWIDEGDQRVIAEQLVAILRGETPKREKTLVPDIQETAQAMKVIYEAIV